MKRLQPKILFYLLAMNIAAGELCAQGCSDAGFCTAGQVYAAETEMDSLYNNNAMLSLQLAQGEQKSTVLITQLELRRMFGKRWSAEIKLPFYSASGKLGHYRGFGDPLITLSRLWTLNSSTSITGTLGARIGTGQANAVDDFGNALPMVYQSSLGTTDIIAVLEAGLGSYISVSAGYQQPVIQYNKNGYITNSIQSANEHYNDYFSSKDLRRKGDVLLRFEGRLPGKKLTLAAGPLLIYHLGEDEATDNQNNRYHIANSGGATLNLAANMGYSSGRLLLQASAAAPLIVRSNRPDGLTRSWIISAGVGFRF